MGLLLLVLAPVLLLVIFFVAAGLFGLRGHTRLKAGLFASVVLSAGGFVIAGEPIGIIWWAFCQIVTAAPIGWRMSVAGKPRERQQN